MLGCELVRMAIPMRCHSSPLSRRKGWSCQRHGSRLSSRSQSYEVTLESEINQGTLAHPESTVQSS